MRAYGQSVISADSALKATEAGYEVGTRTIVDVLDSTRKLYQAKDEGRDRVSFDGGSSRPGERRLRLVSGRPLR